MENYYRNKSRAIAIIDIIWSSVGLGSTILSFFGLALLTQSERSEFNKQRAETFNTELTLDDTTGPNDEIYFRPNNNRRTHGLYNEVNLRANVVLGAIMLAMAINTIQLIAAIRLLKACDVGVDTHKSIQSCRFWCCITIFFVVIIGLHLFTPGRITVPGQIFSMAQILFRALGLYYVSEFIKEMAHGSILPITVGPGAAGGLGGTGNAFSHGHPNNHPLNLNNSHVNPMMMQANRMSFFPKPPPGYPTTEEPPPPYTTSEAPPPYEHVGKI